MAGIHTVRSGDGLDSLWKISKHHGVSFQEIKKSNPEILQRRPQGDPKYGWVYPGDNVKLPSPASDNGPVCKTTEGCPKQTVEVLALKGPAPFQLCHPATFEVSSYKGTPGPDDKKRIKWLLRDAATGDDLLKSTPPPAIANDDKLQIDCVPFDWHDKNIEVAAQFDKAPTKPMITVKPDSCELFDWIALIAKAERAYPLLSGVEMTDSMRRHCFPPAGYDDDHFRALYGGIPPALVLLPAGALTKSDLDQLSKWTWHKVVSGVESGVVKDFDGVALAAGHVLTGISGGVYRNRAVDITGSLPVPGAGVTIRHPGGELLDNLYAATLGDLGQQAVYVEKGIKSRPYIGLHGEASEAELIGDIDGFNIGASEPLGGSGRRLSEILVAYYCNCNEHGVRKRYSSFSATAMGDLSDQIYRFASTYKYTGGFWGKASGAFRALKSYSDEAYLEFVAWLTTKMVHETTGGGKR